MSPLTSDNHHTNGEHFLVVGLRRDVAEADTRHAGHGEVERRNVHCAARRASIQFNTKGFVVGSEVERKLRRKTRKGETALR